MMTNTGAIRFDIFAGPFTRDSTYIVSPFTSNFSFIPDVPYRLAKQILPILNGEDPQTLHALATTTKGKSIDFHLNDLASPEQQARNAVRGFTTPQVATQDGPNREDDQSQQQALLAHAKDHNILKLTPHLAPTDQRTQVKVQESQHRFPTAPPELQPPASNNEILNETQKLTPGYTTHDDLGRTGDDTLHSPIRFYNVPNCVQAIIPGSDADTQREGEQDTTVDLVFNQFLAPYVLTILNALPSSLSRSMQTLGRAGEAAGEKWSENDVSNYVPGETFTSLLARWVSENWGGNCRDEDDERRIEL